MSKQVSFWLRFDSKTQAIHFLTKAIEYAPPEYDRDDDELHEYVADCIDNYSYVIDKM